MLFVNLETSGRSSSTYVKSGRSTTRFFPSLRKLWFFFSYASKNVVSFNNMEAALRALKSGKSTVAEASRLYGIPETTLRDYCKREGITMTKVCFDLFYYI